MSIVYGLHHYNMKGLYALLIDHQHDAQALEQIANHIVEIGGTRENIRMIAFGILNRFPDYRKPDAPNDLRSKIARLLVPDEWLDDRSPAQGGQ